jgi:AAA domain
MSQMVVSFGGGDHAAITKVARPTWGQFATYLTTEPGEYSDKAAGGWYIPAEFDTTACAGKDDKPCPLERSLQHRHSVHFVARHAITFDFDKVSIDTWGDVLIAWEDTAFAIYTTHSHTPEAPRFRVVMPLSRPAGFDEFQAVARKVAADVGIELVARESFVPAQMMYCPARKLGGLWASRINQGALLDVDQVLAEYKDWTDKSSWPRRREGDPVHAAADTKVDPRDKPGIIGEFNRAFSVSAAIQKFELPYVPTNTPDRWTYALGSRPEGAIVYDDDTKFHSHHDTDPARGQNSAYDLVRLHRFGHLDAAAPGAGIADRPSSEAMARFVAELPEIRGSRAADELEDLGELPRVTEELSLREDSDRKPRFTVYSASEFGSGPPMEWIVRGLLPRAELAVVYGQPGSSKSFFALDLCAAITRGIQWRERRTAKGRVVYVCAEGAGGFKARLKAYARGHSVGLAELPHIIPDAPNLLDPKDAAAITTAIVGWAKGFASMTWPLVDCIVLDTMASVTPGGDENSAKDVGKLLEHCRLIHKHTGALVILIAHSGKDESKGVRGWSGTRAAVDVEIEITRNGDYRKATVTKGKDFVDSEFFDYKLKVIELGEVDGEMESSCVVEHVENAPTTAAGKMKPGGRHEVVVLDVLKTVAPSGSVDLEDLRNGYLAKMPAAGETDKNRKRDFKRALENLCSKRLCYMHENDRVSLTSLVTSTGDWLE